MTATPLSPIVLFVYNRPSHVRRTLEALSGNVLSGQSKLYIYADGPKEDASEDEIRRIHEVRGIIKERKWCGGVEVIERERNYGLAKSIVAGVTNVVDCHGKVIVLEDDLVVSPGFLTYMNNALVYFSGNEKIISISAYMYELKKRPSTAFFLRGADCWGWGTWKRGWDLYRPDVEGLVSKIENKNDASAFNFYHTYPYFSLLKEQKKQSDSWAIIWYASAFVADKLTLYPPVSFVRNIGQDGSGLHAKSNFINEQLASQVGDFNAIPIKEDEEIKRSIAEYFKKNGDKKTNFTKKLGKIWNYYKG